MSGFHVSHPNYERLSFLAEESGESLEQFIGTAIGIGFQLADDALQAEPEVLQIGFYNSLLKAHQYYHLDFKDNDLPSGTPIIDELEEKLLQGVIEDLSKSNRKRVYVPVQKELMEITHAVADALETSPSKFLATSFHFRWQWSVTERAGRPVYVYSPATNEFRAMKLD